MDSAEKPLKVKPFFRRDPLVSIVFLLLIFFVSQFIAGLLISLYPAVQSWTQAEALDWLSTSTAAQFAYILLAEVIAVAAVLRIIRWAGVRRQRIGIVKPKWIDAGYALVAYGLYFLTYLAVVIVAQMFLTGVDFEQEQQIGFEAAYSTAALLMSFASLVILPPIAEEIMFRGFLFTSLRAKFNFWLATVITSILFGIAHLQFGSDAPLLWVAAIDTFVLSCFLCYLRERTGSLWPPILLHAIKNCIAFIILFGPRFL